VKRPISTLIVMVLAGILFVASLVGLVLDPKRVLEARPWLVWYLDIFGYIIAPVTCWTLWKKAPRGRWWGLAFIAFFALFGIFSKLHQTQYKLGGAAPIELFAFLSSVVAFAYWFAFSEKSRTFFKSASTSKNEP